MVSLSTPGVPIGCPATLMPGVPSRSVSKFSKTMPSSAVPGMLSGPATFTCVAPAGRSRSARTFTGTFVSVPSASDEMSDRLRSRVAGSDPLALCTVCDATSSK